MKKIASLVLVLLLCMALCVPASAEDEPTEITPIDIGYGYKEIDVTDGGNYIVRDNCELYALEMNSGSLTIAKGASVVVNMSFSLWSNCTITVENGAVLTVRALTDIQGTINVHGKFDIEECSSSLQGVINEYCDGNVVSNAQNSVIINYSIHAWDANTGKCDTCGIKCANEFHNGVHKCSDCGMEFSASVVGSVLSNGSLTIVCSVAAFVLGLGVMFFITKKKKPALVSGENTGEE